MITNHGLGHVFNFAVFSKIIQLTAEQTVANLVKFVEAFYQQTFFIYLFRVCVIRFNPFWNGLYCRFLLT